MKLKKNIAVSESGYIFNPVTGDSFSLNPIGNEIINHILNKSSYLEIKNILLEKYETDNATVDKDLEDFINTLKNFQFLDDESEA